MNLAVGIVGLPNSGKSTLFNALLRRQIAQVAEYPYTTIEPNVGVVEVPDRRLSLIADRLSIEKIVPAAIRFIDIAGLIKGAHAGEGLGNQFLAHIREVDAILHVVRNFDPSTASGQEIPHVMGDINPTRDIEIVNLELELGGIQKPTIYVLNADEHQISQQLTVNSLQKEIQTVAGSQSTVVSICAKLEAELSDLPEDEQIAYLKEVGINRSSLDQVISASYKLLDLITFFTIAGGKSSSAKASARPRMVQAWPVKVGTTMIEAAAVVHTDFARGFITAEVCNWQKLVNAGTRPEGRGSPGATWHNAKEKGLLHFAGRDEIVKDGEVVEFKFRV